MPRFVFADTTPGVYDPLTGVTTGAAVTTISGDGIVKSSGDPQRYKALGLQISTASTILFTPDSYPLRSYTTDFVRPGMTTVLNGLTLTVRDVAPIGPDGNVIAANIIVSA